MKPLRESKDSLGGYFHLSPNRSTFEFHLISVWPNLDLPLARSPLATVRHVPIMMNARVYVEAEVVARTMEMLAMQILIVADILLKAALMVNVRNKKKGGDY